MKGLQEASFWHQWICQILSLSQPDAISIRYQLKKAKLKHCWNIWNWKYFIRRMFVDWTRWAMCFCTNKWWFGAIRMEGCCSIDFWLRCWCWNNELSMVKFIDWITYRYHIHRIRTSPPFWCGWCLCAMPKTIPPLVFHF